jgi:hypothetical protein
MAKKRKYLDNIWIPWFFMLITPIILGASFILTEILSTEGESPAVIPELIVFFPTYLFIIILFANYITLINEIETKVTKKKIEKITLRDIIFKKLKGSFVGGITASIIFCIIAIIDNEIEPSYFGQNIYYLSIPIFFFGGAIAELINKQKSVKLVYVYGGGFVTAIYGAITFLLIFVVGYLVLIKGIWQHPMIVEDWKVLLNPVSTLFGLTFFPTFFGGLTYFGFCYLKNRPNKKKK